MTASLPLKKYIDLSENNDVWGGWEVNVDYEVNAGDGDDTLYGYAGDDTLTGGDGDDEIYGALGDDTLKGGRGQDLLFGGVGNDFISGGRGNDEVFGGLGNDRLRGGRGKDRLFGEDGNDEIDGGKDDDEVFGGNGDDTLRGGAGQDKIFGDEGNDKINGGQGDDEAFGGNGDDTLRGGAGQDKLFGGDGNDKIAGGEGDDEIYGEGGRNTLRGGGGRDRIYGGNDADKISGGLDEDTLFGNGGDDFIQGNEQNDTIFGGEGDDDLEGNSGNDTLFGESGQDSLAGNEGDDDLFGGEGNDVVSGGSGDDSLYGHTGDDTLEGGSGQDVLDGGEGNDALAGGQGSDRLFGDVGDDVLSGVLAEGAINDGDYGPSTGQDTVDTLIGGAGRDLFVLGNRESVFYDDGNAATVGASDYALIKDFNRLEDSIQLKGVASDYVVASLPTPLTADYSEMTAAGIYLDTNGSGTWEATDELIAVVEHLTPETLVLEGGYFQYTEMPAQSLWHPAKDEQWELVFSDEFDRDFLDSDKWKTRYSQNFYEGRTNLWNAEQQAYVGDNEVIDGVAYDAFEFNEGVLTIVAQKVESAPITLALGDTLDGFESVKQFDYSSGMLTSHDHYAFTYGYMEIGAQVPAGQGIWPAFWMLPLDGGWPPEIDIMEALGQQTDTTYNSFHYTNEFGNTMLSKGVQTFENIDFSADFHTYGVAWSADELTWFVDGQALFSVDHHIPDVPMYLLANLAVGGYWPGSPDETTPETSAFEIDFIRVYQNDQGTLHGGSKDDVLTKSLGHLAGEAGDDVLIGGQGDNQLFGGADDDLLMAAGGRDVLMGTDDVHAGRGEIDTLSGGSGADLFVLGRDGQLFYDDADLSTAGVFDYALITDFEVMYDQVQLIGDALDYRLGSTTQGQSTELWFTSASAVDELIAIFDQQTISTFDTGFSFVV